MLTRSPIFPVFFFFALTLFFFSDYATAQSARPNGTQGAGTSSRSAGTAALPAGGRAGRAGRFQQQAAPQPLFPTNLGNNVGLQAFPAVTMPGYGNINQPGLPPGTPSLIPNINNPSGSMIFSTPPPSAGSAPHGPQGFHRGGGGNTVIYATPYAVPYYVYPAPPEDQGAAAPPNGAYAPEGNYYYGYAPYPPPAAAPAPVAAAAPQGSLPSTVMDERLNPMDIPDEPPASGPANTPTPNTAKPHGSDAAKAAPSKPKKVTLLAFRDGTIVGVTDYWLEKYKLVYSRGGSRTEVALEKLDLAKTVQLNTELGVPVEFESR